MPHGPDKKKRADFSRVQSGSSSTAPAAGWLNTQLTQSFQGSLSSRPDATAAPGPRPAVSGETTRGLRNLLAGIAESVDRIPADAIGMLGGLLSSDRPAITGGGRGGSPARTAPELQSLGNLLKPGADELLETATRSSESLGDFIAGETLEEAGSFGGNRQIGDLLGMVAGPEALVAGARALRPTNPLIRRLLEPGGATLTPKGEAFAGTGYAVADPKLIGSFRTPAEAERFLSRADVKRALAEGRHIGKWTDPVSGVTEINITDLFPDQKEALRVAARRGEQAIGDIQGGEYAGDIANPHAPVREAKALVEQMNGGRMLPRAEEVPAERGRQLAETYEALPKVDPNARPAYEALNREIEQQYKAITDAGYKIEFTDADPYRNSAEMMADIRDNKTLKVFKTPGEGAHPFMTADQNDRFRAVHDFIAHGGGGNQFGALGEENAYRIHASTLSPEAKRALATETRGQNSWVNFGPNSHLPVGERPFAEQKAALFPEGLLDDYDTMPVGEAEKVIGRDATGAAYTNRGNVVREPAPLPALLDSESERALIRDKHGNIYTNRDRTIDGPRAPELDEVGLPANPQGRFSQPYELDRRGNSGTSIMGGMTAGGLLGGAAGAELSDDPNAALLGLAAGMVGGAGLGMAGGRAASRAGGLLDEAGVTGRPRPIRAAALRLKDGRVVDGPSHADAFERAFPEADGAMSSWDDEVADAGFLDADGNFLTHDDAIAVAQANRQIRNERIVGHEGLASENVRMLGNERGAIGWQPTPRGVFDRSSSTRLQGQAQIDPRLEARMPRGEASELSQAVADSRVVREGLRSDMEAGLPLGGDIWYEQGPVQDVLGEEGLRRFNVARGSGSIQNPTHNELATASGLLFGEAQGLGSMADIRAAHREMYPREAKLWGSEGTFTNYRNALEAGAQLPSTPGSAERKVPWYTHGLEGGSLEGGVALDTHERRRLTQLAATDKKVKKLLKQLGITDVTGVRAEPLPITNALDYELLSEPYRRLAQEMGLPSAQAAQAGRWIGGGKFTGLKSQPMGDAMQTLEDGLLHTSMTRGLPTDPASLSKLFERLATGQDIATPVYGKDPFAALYSGQGLLGF